MSAKAIFKGNLCSIDLPNGPDQLPRNPDDCWILVYADIGMQGSEAIETFLFYVCTLKRLERIVRYEGFEFGRHLIILERFNWKKIEQAITAICDATTGEDWEEIAAKLASYGERDADDCQDSAFEGRSRLTTV